MRYEGDDFIHKAEQYFDVDPLFYGKAVELVYDRQMNIIHLFVKCA